MAKEFRSRLFHRDIDFTFLLITLVLTCLPLLTPYPGGLRGALSLSATLLVFWGM